MSPVSPQLVTSDHWQQQLVLDLTSAVVAAHFPGMPMIAGYQQLSWVESLLSEVAPQWRISEVVDVKFRIPIVPPTEVQLELVLDAGRQQADFRAVVGERETTKGRVALASR